jgi:hypothetical protein
MEIVNAYAAVGSYRGAAALCGTTHKTVKRVLGAAGARSGRATRIAAQQHARCASACRSWILTRPRAWQPTNRWAPVPAAVVT